MTNIEIGNRIRIAREKKGLNKKELAQKIQVADSTIKRYEDGDIKKIKMPIIESIANTLHINPMWIIGKEPTMERDPFHEYWGNEKHREMDFHEFIHGYLGYDSPYTLDGYVDIVLKKEPEVIYKVSAKEYDDFYEFTKDRIDREFDFLLNKAQKIQKENKTNVIPLPQEDKSYLDPVAAHKRTDIANEDITDEMKQHDLDIMNNDDFWK